MDSFLVYVGMVEWYRRKEAASTEMVKFWAGQENMDDGTFGNVAVLKFVGKIDF